MMSMQNMSFGGCAQPPAMMSVQDMSLGGFGAPKNAPNEYEYVIS